MSLSLRKRATGTYPPGNEGKNQSIGVAGMANVANFNQTAGMIHVQAEVKVTTC